MSNRFQRTYNGHTIRGAYENGQVLFNLIDCVPATGYSRTASLRHHTKGKNREVNLFDGIYLSAKTLGKIGRDASNINVTPFANWAKQVTDQVLALAQSQPTAHHSKKTTPRKKSVKSAKQNTAVPVFRNMDVPAALPTLLGIKEAAKTLNMTAGALSDWLVAQGYAGRYVSNNALFWKKWFKEQCYGTRPVISDNRGVRESNVAKLTTKGLEFVKARLESERETNVLSFAKKGATEREKLEKELDDLIIQTFLPHVSYRRYTGILGDHRTHYELDNQDLNAKIKSIIAQVKLKENDGPQGSNV
jgi:phage antirepressor YoqD-like protein